MLFLDPVIRTFLNARSNSSDFSKCMAVNVWVSPERTLAVAMISLDCEPFEAKFGGSGNTARFRRTAGFGGSTGAGAVDGAGEADGVAPASSVAGEGFSTGRSGAAGLCDCACMN